MMRVTRLFRCVSRPGSVMAPSLLLRQQFNFSDPSESIPELRRKLASQEREKLSRMQTINTESRLILQLSRSGQAEEREEALEVGEDLWAELSESDSPIPLSSRTTMKITLCSALRRCALVSKDRELAEQWTVRFAERASSFSVKDFMQQPPEDDHVRGWREARAQVRPGTGITADDLEADAREESETAERSRDGEKKQRPKGPTPFDQYRQTKMMEHPVVDLAFRRQPGPGPRYTG